MRILLDDNPCPVDATSVGEAIDAAAAVAEAKGRLIIEVTVDGAPWSEADLASPQRRADGAELVRLTSAETTGLVRQTFAEAAEALTDADMLQRQAAESLQSDEPTVCMDKLNDAISIWLSVREAIVKGTLVAGLDLDAGPLQASIEAAIQRLNEQLEAVRRALTDRDEVALADALLYEFPDVVGSWRDILNDLQRALP